MHELQIISCLYLQFPAISFFMSHSAKWWQLLVNKLYAPLTSPKLAASFSASASVQLLPRWRPHTAGHWWGSRPMLHVVKSSIMPAPHSKVCPRKYTNEWSNLYGLTFPVGSFMFWATTSAYKAAGANWSGLALGWAVASGVCSGKPQKKSGNSTAPSHTSAIRSGYKGEREKQYIYIYISCFQ